MNHPAKFPRLSPITRLSRLRRGLSRAVDRLRAATDENFEARRAEVERLEIEVARQELREVKHIIKVYHSP